jgi:hypothetical protein
VRCNIVEAVIIESNCVLWLVHCGACSTNGERRGACKVLVGKPEGKKHLEEPGVNGRIILRWISKKWEGGGMDWIDLA